jgi:PAS domain S-box-containing protein
MERHSHCEHGEHGWQQRLLGTVERIAQTGSWAFAPSADVLLWSDNLYRIFGVEPGEVQPSIEYVLAMTDLADRQQLKAAIGALVERGEPRVVDYRITRPDGEQRHLRSTLVVLEPSEGASDGIAGVVQDRTDRHSAEREIAAHVAVEEALVEWEALEPGANGLLARLAGALDCAAGVFWVPHGDILVPRVVWHQGGLDPRSQEPVRARSLRGESGLPARAWKDREPLTWTVDSAASGDQPDAAFDDGGLSGAIAIPALEGTEVLAIVEMKTDREMRVSERLMRSLHGIGHELGHFLARRGAELTGSLLTRREIQILQIAAQGLSARQTAELLTISASTVTTHLKNAYRKLDVPDRASAVAAAFRLGLID